MICDFFKFNFKHYLIRAGYHRTDLSSPKLYPTGIMSHGGNSAENKIATIFEAQDKCQVAAEVQYSDSKYSDLKRYALC